MSHDAGLDDELFSRLHDLDLELTQSLQLLGCPHCGARLDRADFPRKVRGVPESAEPLFETRFGLCCSREGCRRRVLPPSLRFLGRKVYAAAVIVTVCVAEAAARRWQEARRIARWLYFFREVFGRSAIFTQLRGRLAVPVDVGALPRSLLGRIEASNRSEQLIRFLALVAGVAPPSAHAN